MAEEFSLSTSYLLYQAADLSFDFQSEAIVASTVLWLTFSREIVPGAAVHLHCRQCKITEVLVNGVPAEFCLNDAIKSLCPDAPTFESTELDRNYRAALDVSKLGELRITIPSFEKTEPLFHPINRIPLGAPKDVQARFDALMNLYRTLKPKSVEESSHHKAPASQDDDDDDILENIINRKPERDLGKLLQIKISYILERKRGQSIIGGYIFRRQKQYADSFGGFYGNDQESLTDASCVYSISGAKSNQSLEQIDGVRCWLPCIDSLDQRAIFDVTLHAPRIMSAVVCSGKRLSKSERFIKRSKLQPLFEPHEDTGEAEIDEEIEERKDVNHELLAYTSTRFFCASRIPVSSVGFFIGTAESYQMPLYRCRGRVLVALNINDYAAQLKVKTGKISAIIPLASHDQKSETNVRIINIADNDVHTEDRPNKRIRFQSKDQTEHKPSGRKRSVSFSSSYSDADVISLKWTELPIQSSEPMRNVYEDKVRHSQLGFDMAIRFIHKLLGRRYHQESYTQIYIHELETESFIAFDGFSLVDAKNLHSEAMVYLETPHHLTAIHAYLYGYITSTFPVLGYFQEYLIHGIVGYIAHLYLKSVYGDDESVYHQQRVLDTVLTLEKLHQKYVDGLQSVNIDPIACVRYPESYERFLPWQGSYLVNKSILLMHVVESRVGGSEPIRRALQQLIRAPSTEKTSHNTTAPSSPTTAGNTSLARQSSVGSEDSAPLGPSTGIYAPTTPSHYDTYLQKLNRSAVTGAGSGNSSPYQDSLGTMGSPELYPQTPDFYAAEYSSVLSPQWNEMSPDGSNSPASLLRQTSLEGAPGNASGPVTVNFPESLIVDLATGESFFELLRGLSGAASELQSSVLESLVYSNKTLRGKLDISVDPKVEGKTRNFYLSFDPISGDEPSALVQTASNVSLVFRVCEMRDNNTTEPELLLLGQSMNAPGRRTVLTHSQAMISPPGRRPGSKAKASTQPPPTDAPLAATTVTSPPDIPIELDSCNVIVKLLYHFNTRSNIFDIPILSFAIDRPSRRSAVQLAREKEYPLKYCLFDPLMTLQAAEVNIGGLPDPMLVEQLFLEVDMFDIIRQYQALRGIAVSPITTVDIKRLVSAAGSRSSLLARPDKYHALQLHALADCLQGVNPVPLTAIAIAKGETQQSFQQSVHVRVEAAYSLVQWHFHRMFENAVFDSSILEKSLQNYQGWEGAAVLLKMIIELCIDSSTGQFLLQDDSDEWFVYLRNGVLTALSMIKSSNNITPVEVTEFFVLYAEQGPYSSSMASQETNPKEKAQVEVCTHHAKAVLLAALSRITFPKLPISEVTSAESKSLFSRIVSFAVDELKVSLLTAVTRSRMDHAPNNRNAMPITPAGGILAASAISCLGQLDRQAMTFLESFKGRLTPSTTGLSSKLDYAQFFLPDGVQLTHSHTNNDPDAIRVIPSFSSPLNSPIMRIVALEAFVSICLSSYSSLVVLSQQAQLQQQLSAAADGSQTKVSLRIPENSFLPAAIEAVLAVVRYDPNASVRQRAAKTWLTAIQDGSFESLTAAMTFGNRGGGLNVSDSQALSYVDPYKLLLSIKSQSSKLASNVRSGLRAIQQGLKKEVKKWWKQIALHSASDQATRSLLLTAWIATFCEKMPRSLTVGQGGQPSEKPLSHDDRQLHTLLETCCPPLPHVGNPIESLARVSTRMMRGSSFVLPQAKQYTEPVRLTKPSAPASTVQAPAILRLHSSKEVRPKPEISQSIVTNSNASIPPPAPVKVKEETPSEAQPLSSTSMKLSLKIPLKRASSDASIAMDPTS